MKSYKQFVTEMPAPYNDYKDLAKDKGLDLTDAYQRRKAIRMFSSMQRMGVPKGVKEGNVTGINDGGKKDAQSQANKDMMNTKYDPTEGKRRGKGLRDRLLKGV